MEFSFRPRITRQFVRRVVQTDCQVVAEDGFRLLGEYTEDLSEAGLLLSTDAYAAVGESVLISVRTPNGSSWIDAEGHVQRVLWDRYGRRALGIGFRTLSLMERALLGGSLYGRPPALVPDQGRRDYASAVIQMAA